MVIVIFKVRTRARLKKPLEERRILSVKSACLLRLHFIHKRYTAYTIRSVFVSKIRDSDDTLSNKFLTFLQRDKLPSLLSFDLRQISMKILV